MTDFVDVWIEQTGGPTIPGYGRAARIDDQFDIQETGIVSGQRILNVTHSTVGADDAVTLHEIAVFTQLNENFAYNYVQFSVGGPTFLRIMFGEKVPAGKGKKDKTILYTYGKQVSTGEVILGCLEDVFTANPGLGWVLLWKCENGG